MVTSGIPWSENPRNYLRPYPAWFTLFRELSRERLTLAKAARILAVPESFIHERHKNGRTMSRSKDKYSLMDLVALSILASFDEEPQKLDFLDRMIWDHESMVWQSLIAITQGNDIYIAADFDRTMTHPFFSTDAGSPEDLGEGQIPIPLNIHFQKVLIDHSWPGLVVRVNKANKWTFHFEKKGYLQLDELPCIEQQSKSPSTSGVCESKDDLPDEYGHKQLTVGNHLAPDHFFRTMEWWGDNTENRQARVNERISEIISIQMHPVVPTEVRKMFDLLKGGMVYGFYYRPIFSLLGDQVYFIADAALHHKCKLLGINDKDWNFKKRISVLKTRGVIEADEGFLWDAMLSLRDNAAHQTHRPLNWPPNEISNLQTVADDVSRLFMPFFADQPPSWARS